MWLKLKKISHFRISKDYNQLLTPPGSTSVPTFVVIQKGIVCTGLCKYNYMYYVPIKKYYCCEEVPFTIIYKVDAQVLIQVLLLFHLYMYLTTCVSSHID